MASSKEHYENVLADVYSWMYGGFAAALERNMAFFRERDLLPAGSRTAIDLGAGCGFQSIPLAQLGYAVTAIDLDRKLLAELSAHADGLDITTIEADLLGFRSDLRAPVELVVCMVDTLLHLDSPRDAARLIADVHSALEPGGSFVVTFRDLTHELLDLDRFIPVRSDAGTVFTCFLEYEADTVKVHDLVYRMKDDRWVMLKSFYRKLRLSEQWISDQIEKAGFEHFTSECTNGIVTVVATKRA